MVEISDESLYEFRVSCFFEDGYDVAKRNGKPVEAGHIARAAGNLFGQFYRNNPKPDFLTQSMACFVKSLLVYPSETDHFKNTLEELRSIIKEGKENGDFRSQTLFIEVIRSGHENCPYIPLNSDYTEHGIPSDVCKLVLQTCEYCCGIELSAIFANEV